jgi:hypothetical protein
VGGTGPALGWGGQGIGTSGRGEEVGKWYKRVNLGQILCTYVCKCKNETVETIPGMGEEGIKESSGEGVNSSMIYLICVRTFVNATMYPTQHNNLKITV